MSDTPPHLIDDAETPPAAPATRAAAARVPSGASAAAQTAPFANVPQALPAELPVLTEVVNLSTTAEPTALQDESATAIDHAPATETTEPAKATVPELSPAECAARLAALFPALFASAPNTPPKPIKLRIQADIQASAPGLFSRRSLSPFLHRFTTTTAYLRALVGSAHRYDLDGAPAGEVSDEHRQAAQLELERRRAIVQARRAAERQAGRVAPATADELGAAHAPQTRRDAGRPPAPRGPRGPQMPGEPHGPREAGERRAPRPPHTARPPQTPRDAAAPSALRPRPQRPPRHAPQTRPDPRPHTGPQIDMRPEPAHTAAALPDDPARRERALLLRAYEATTLSRANFCALKRIDPASLDALLEQARSEARPAAAPKRPAR